MIACRCCLQHFAPTAATYVGTQIFAMAAMALHNCPNTDASGEVCASTAALVIWSGYETEELPIAAE